MAPFGGRLSDPMPQDPIKVVNRNIIVVNRNIIFVKRNMFQITFRFRRTVRHQIEKLSRSGTVRETTGVEIVTNGIHLYEV